MGNNLYLTMLAFEQLVYRKASDPLGSGRDSGAESLAVRLSAGQLAECPLSILRGLSWINLRIPSGQVPWAFGCQGDFRGGGMGCLSGSPGFCARAHPALTPLS